MRNRSGGLEQFALLLAALGHDQGYIRLSLFSAAQPLYTRFPIIFIACFSKVTIGYYPRHDTAHDGVSNGFHIAVGSEHARLYNDLSPLENMHGARHSGNRELYR